LVLENKQAAKVQEALREFNIPSVLHTTASLFDSHEAAELYRVLAGIAPPGDERLVKSALATDLFGVDGSQLAECTEAQWQEWLQLFHDYGEFWCRHGFFRMFRHWLQRQQVRQRLLAFPDGERRLTNILHLGEVLHHAKRSAGSASAACRSGSPARWPRRGRRPRNTSCAWSGTITP